MILGAETKNRKIKRNTTLNCSMSLASGEFLPAVLTPFLPQIHGKQELHELLHDACSGRNLQIEIDKS